MPLSPPSARREIHDRVISLKAFARDDGWFDVEAHLVDVKPFPFQRLLAPQPAPAGAALHDLWVRLVLDGDYVVQAVEAASDITPFPVCKEAETTLSVLVGQRVGAGWTRIVKERLAGAKGCTHLAEMLLPLATTALQGIRGLRPEERASVDAQGRPHKLDSCYAYATHRDVVKMVWPEHYQPRGKAEPGG